MHAQWESSRGVPLSAIIFCTRRRTGVPLISEAFTWQHGVFRASTIRTDALNSRKGENRMFVFNASVQENASFSGLFVLQFPWCSRHLPSQIRNVCTGNA